MSDMGPSQPNSNAFDMQDVHADATQSVKNAPMSVPILFEQPISMSMPASHTVKARSPNVNANANANVTQSLTYEPMSLHASNDASPPLYDLNARVPLPNNHLVFGQSVMNAPTIQQSGMDPPITEESIPASKEDIKTCDEQVLMPGVKPDMQPATKHVEQPPQHPRIKNRNRKAPTKHIKKPKKANKPKNRERKQATKQRSKTNRKASTTKRGRKKSKKKPNRARRRGHRKVSTTKCMLMFVNFD